MKTSNQTKPRPAAKPGHTTLLTSKRAKQERPVKKAVKPIAIKQNDQPKSELTSMNQLNKFD